MLLSGTKGIENQNGIAYEEREGTDMKDAEDLEGQVHGDFAEQPCQNQGGEQRACKYAREQGVAAAYQCSRIEDMAAQKDENACQEQLFPCFSKTKRRFSSTSAIPPRIKPMMMRFAKRVSDARDLENMPRRMKQKEAEPLRRTAVVNFSLYSTCMKQEAGSNESRPIGRYRIKAFLPSFKNIGVFSLIASRREKIVTHAKKEPLFSSPLQSRAGRI